MSHQVHRRLALAAAAVAATCALPASVHAATAPRFERIAGYASPGTPAKYDKVGILKIGSAKAKNVLVLNPGTSASAAYFAPLAKSLVAQAPGWQVWAVERRENLLEDHTLLDLAKAGRATPTQVFNYYLGWLKDPSVTPHVRLIPDAEVAYARDWGMNTEIQDLRRVVLRAQKLGGKVVVGGHSLGGTITTAYATWDFHGAAGAKGLDGLLLIDGGSGPDPVSTADAQKNLNMVKTGSPWLQFGGIAAPFTGLFNSTGSLGVLLDPDSPSVGQASGLLPADLVPTVPVTNAGQYGYALDTATSPAGLVAAQAHLGHLAETGDPKGWDDAGELTPLRRYAQAFSGWGLKGLDGTAWYHPLRLTIDAGAVAAGNANPAQKVLNVHATHGKDLPKGIKIYAFGASLGGTRILAAARALAKQSHVPSKDLTLVDRHTTYAHNDPNTASPERDDFLKRLVPWLKGVAAAGV
jgi:pimeloyl-ACP methyl ester carboxylesterase